MYTKILVPLDGSQISQCVLSHVRTMALGLNLPQVTILRIVEPLPDDVRNGLVELGGEQIPALEEKRKKEASDYVSGITKMLREEGAHAKGEVLSGTAAGEIINYAQKNSFDLIIMCTHGRSGAYLWAMGSVAQKVSSRSTIPVQLVSAKECVTRGGC
jgi:nucleotide-binding universal stress UspA family protein